MLTLLVGAILATLSPAAPATEPRWIEISPAKGLKVVTDAAEKPGRKAAFQVAQFDRALQKRFTWIGASAEPSLLVFASANEAMVRSMAADTTDAEKDNAFASYLMVPGRHTGALRVDLPEPSDRERAPHRGYFRGRAAWLVEQNLGKAVPSWLSRGLTTFFADTVVKDKEVLTGRMTLGDLEGAAIQALAAAEFFREVPPADKRFDIQAGLFIHYLLLGEGGRHAGTLDALIRQIAAREGPPGREPAMAQIRVLHAGFAKHLAAKKFQPLKLPVDPSITAAGFAIRDVPLADALMLRAEVLFELNRPVDTRGLLRQAKEADPTLVRPLEIEAVLFEREQRSTEARQAIEAAIKRGSQNGSLYYRLAQMQWSRRMAKPLLESVAKLLETAKQLSPEDASVLSYLAEIQGDLGLAQPALENAQKAATDAPQDVYSLMAFARAQWNARNMDEALATARKALALAKLASQKQSVAEFVTFATRNKTAQAKGTKPWTSQFGPPPAGAFGATRAVTTSGRVSVGQARTDSADAAAITDCFARRDDAACARAVPSLEAACNEKQTTSCVSLGSLHEGGFGVTRDRRRAATLYKTACGLGDKAGCARFAVLEVQGLGVPPNSARATKTLESLCEESVPEGCIGLAQILRHTGFMVDRERAQKILKATCDKGSAEACAMMSTR